MWTENCPNFPKLQNALVYSTIWVQYLPNPHESPTIVLTKCESLCPRQLAREMWGCTLHTVLPTATTGKYSQSYRPYREKKIWRINLVIGYRSATEKYILRQLFWSSLWLLRHLYQIGLLRNMFREGGGGKSVWATKPACLICARIFGSLTVNPTQDLIFHCSGARGPPQFLKKHSENAGAN